MNDLKYINYTFYAITGHMHRIYLNEINRLIWFKSKISYAPSLLACFIQCIS